MKDKYETAFFCAKTIEEVLFACAIIDELASDKCILILFIDGADDKQRVENIVKLFAWDKIIYVEGLVSDTDHAVSRGWYSGFKYNVKLQMFNRCSIRELLESAAREDVVDKKGRGSSVFITSSKHVLDQHVIGLMPKADRCWFPSRAGEPSQEYIENNTEIFQKRGRQARRISSQNMTAGKIFEALVIKYAFRVIGEGKHFVPFDGIDRVYSASSCKIAVPVVSVAEESLKKTIELIQDEDKGKEQIEDSIYNILSCG